MLVRPELNSQPPVWQPGAQPTEPPVHGGDWDKLGQRIVLRPIIRLWINMSITDKWSDKTTIWIFCLCWWTSVDNSFGRILCEYKYRLKMNYPWNQVFVTQRKRLFVVNCVVAAILKIAVSIDLTGTQTFSLCFLGNSSGINIFQSRRHTDGSSHSLSHIYILYTRQMINL